MQVQVTFALVRNRYVHKKVVYFEFKDANTLIEAIYEHNKEFMKAILNIQFDKGLTEYIIESIRDTFYDGYPEPPKNDCDYDYE